MGLSKQTKLMCNNEFEMLKIIKHSAHVNPTRARLQKSLPGAKPGKMIS